MCSFFHRIKRDMFEAMARWAVETKATTGQYPDQDAMMVWAEKWRLANE